MNKLYTILFVAFTCISTDAISQNCTSPIQNYDLIVVSAINIPPSQSAYMQGYVCNGGVLTDSATCCTRFLNVDSGGVVIVGPISYGMAYVKNGGTFNGQGASNNWTVYAESGAIVINHTGNTVQCPQIVFPNTNCIMGFTDQSSAKPKVSLIDHTINFGFSAVMNDVRIELLDVSGKVVKSEMMSQSSVHSMDVSGLAAGVYMYRVSQGAELISSDKVVLQ